MCVVASERVFFFKQKTAYEMRISDWSSDVCSSDLGTVAAALSRQPEHGLEHVCLHLRGYRCETSARRQYRSGIDRHRGVEVAGQLPGHRSQYRQGLGLSLADVVEAGWQEGDVDGGPAQRRRSEENTSELQSLMRITYAVF